jgi:FKBP-type peptidyl-prolyl cis-trans isomerase FkpA
MKVLSSSLLVLVLAGALPARAQTDAGKPVSSEEEDRKVLYALGFNIGQNLASNFAPSKAELEIIRKGLVDAVTGAKPANPVDDVQPKIAALQQKRHQVIVDAQKEKGKAFAAKAAKEPGAKLDPDGLVYRELKAGTGETPKATDRVKVNYKGTLIDGTEFDSSYKRGQPAEFPLNGVIKCWTEGVQKMKPGGKAKLVCPSDIAYGDRGSQGKIAGGATLIFEVELISAFAAPPTPPPGQFPPGGPGRGLPQMPHPPMPVHPPPSHP